MDRLKLGIILGGRSGERTVSCASGISVARAARADRYDVSLIGITPEGKWLLLDSEKDVERPDDPGRARIRPGAGRPISPVPWTRSFAFVDEKGSGLPGRLEIDVVFPALHGPFGEDGTVQGLFEVMDMPYVGATVLGSSIGMDKDVTKRLARDAGLEIAPFLVVRDRHWIADRDAATTNVQAWCEKQGYPAFVKPSNMGSSVGISKVKDPGSVAASLEEAFRHDSKVVVEKGIDAREIECAVLGGSDPEAASALGEIVPDPGDFYTFDAKYLNSTRTVVPADLDAPLVARIRHLAVRAFRALDCYGMARVDFLVDRATGTPCFSELNTIPGFTRISMYASMWEASGLPYPALIDRLVDLALEWHRASPASR